jgi:alcohol dehydrogenase
MAYNLPGALEKFADIADAMGEITEGLSIRDAADLAVEAVDALIEDCGINATLEDLEIPEDDFEELAKVALTVARPLENNPRKVTLEDAIDIYRAAY